MSTDITQFDAETNVTGHVTAPRCRLGTERCNFEIEYHNNDPTNPEMYVTLPNIYKGKLVTQKYRMRSIIEAIQELNRRTASFGCNAYMKTSIDMHDVRYSGVLSNRLAMNDVADGLPAAQMIGKPIIDLGKEYFQSKLTYFNVVPTDLINEVAGDFIKHGASFTLDDTVFKTYLNTFQYITYGEITLEIDDPDGNKATKTVTIRSTAPFLHAVVNNGIDPMFNLYCPHEDIIDSSEEVRALTNIYNDDTPILTTDESNLLSNNIGNATDMRFRWDHTEKTKPLYAGTDDQITFKLKCASDHVYNKLHKLVINRGDVDDRYLQSFGLRTNKNGDDGYLFYLILPAICNYAERLFGLVNKNGDDWTYYFDRSNITIDGTCDDAKKYVEDGHVRVNRLTIYADVPETSDQ